MKNTSKWGDLRYVLAVADAGSVNAAAKNLGVNHATILRRIASFEDTHDISVFQRSATGYCVSPEGTQIIEAIRSVDRSIDAMERVIAGKDTRLDGVIKMTSTDSLCRTVLPPLIAEFHKAYPELTILLSSTNARLNLSKLDAEITLRPAKNLPADLTGTRVATMRFRVFGSQGYLVANPLANLTKHRWLGVVDPLSRSPVGAWQEQLPPDQIVFKADSFVTLADMTETGLGLSMLPCCLGDHSEMLRPAQNLSDELETGVWLATHKDLKSSDRITATLEFLQPKIAAALNT